MRGSRILSIGFVTILAGAVAVAATSPKKGTSASTSKAGQAKAPRVAGKLKTSSPSPRREAPPAPAAILWDQTDLAATNASPDQDFEAIYDAYDCNAADDFVVPASGWSISRVNTLGVYTAGDGPAASVDVIISADAAGVPGAPMAGCTYLGVVPTDTAGDYNIDLVPPCSLLVAGTYWVEVQTNMDYNPGTQQHYWVTRTASNGLGGVWQNPGGGFATDCATWGPIQSCLPTAGGPDWAFSLEGTVLPVELQKFQAD
jgi:hypothetical protein